MFLVCISDHARGQDQLEKLTQHFLIKFYFQSISVWLLTYNDQKLNINSIY